jgi:hypothetical protein
VPTAIARGAAGPHVRELQRNLRARGIDVKDDSIFGRETDAAVRTFQKSAGLPPDGIAGPRTWNALLGAASVRRRAVEPPPPRDWSFERMLTDLGAWAEEHNPFAAGTPAARPSAPTPRRAASSPAPAAKPAAKPGRAAPRVVVGGEASRYQRVSFDGYDGRGWVLKDYRKLLGTQVREFRNGTFAVNPADAIGWKKNECVHLVKYFGVPYTGTWRRGPQVCHFKPGELPVGTVIATLRDDVYHSDYSGRSHVGIYLSHDDYTDYTAVAGKTAGLWMMDQWNGATIRRSKRHYAVVADALGKKAKKGWTTADGKRMSHRVNWIRDGEEYFVVMTK